MLEATVWVAVELHCVILTGVSIIFVLDCISFSEVYLINWQQLSWQVVDRLVSLMEFHFIRERIQLILYNTTIKQTSSHRKLWLWAAVINPEYNIKNYWSVPVSKDFHFIAALEVLFSNILRCQRCHLSVHIRPCHIFSQSIHCCNMLINLLSPLTTTQRCSVDHILSRACSSWVSMLSAILK